ncbi:MAG: hypothetical protein FJ102_26570 [Deltaproteobacteria bacterium]|nr:hypothetical protein [Deltaproteobacteria bacterium]
MALANNPVIPADGQLVISDSSGTPLSLTIQYEDGDFQMGEVEPNQKSVQEFRDRGDVYAVREVERTNLEWTFSCHCVGFTDAGAATPLDIARLGGTWGSAVSKLTAAYGGANLFQLVFTAERTNFGGAADSTVTLKYSRVRVAFQEGVPGKLVIKGTSFVMAHDVANSVSWT